MRLVITFCLLAASIAHAGDVDKKFWTHAELNAVWQGKNENQIPAETGTRFNLAVLDRSAAFTGRIYFGYRLNSKNEIRALYAPLSLDLSGSFSSPVSFQGSTFAANTPVEAHYKFNSYRLTYRYLIVENERWDVKVGATGKIRDAEVRLSQAGVTQSKTNVGFVPLLHLAADYSFSEDFSFHFDADFIASPYGRAEDIALLAGVKSGENTELLFGYRTVEGGTDGESSGDVYSFAWIHYAVAALKYDF